MSKTSKARRDQKKKRLKAKGKAKSHQQGMGKTFMQSERELDNPFTSLTAKQDMKIKDMHDAIKQVIKHHDPIMLMSKLVYYQIAALNNLESIIEGDKALTQPQLELLQAIMLQMKAGNFGDDIHDIEAPSRISDYVAKLETSINTQNAIELEMHNLASEATSDRAVELVASNILNLLHSTNSSMPITDAINIFGSFDDRVKEAWGFTGTEAMMLFEIMTETIIARIDRHLKDMADVIAATDKKQMFKEFCRIADLPESEIIDIAEKVNNPNFTREALLLGFIRYHDLRARQMFKFHPKDLAQGMDIPEATIVRIFSRFSLKPGDLRSRNIKNLASDNPVLQKPVLNTGNEYYCFMPYNFFGSINRHYAEALGPSGEDGLLAARHSYLVNIVNRDSTAKLPVDELVRNAQWQIDGVPYQTDIAMRVDSCLILIDTISHDLTDQHLLKADSNARNFLMNNIIAPGIVSAQLEDKINGIIANRHPDKDNGNAYPLNMQKVKKVVLYSVSMDNAMMLEMHLALAQERGWMPDDYRPCLILSLNHLKMLLQLFDSPAHAIHYIQRRNEMEREQETMSRENETEIEYMGFYLASQFNYFGQHKKGIAKQDRGRYAAQILEYIDKVEMRQDASRPPVENSPLFQDIMSKMASSGRHRWIEAACLLNHFHPKEQERIAKQCEKLQSSASRSSINLWDNLPKANMLRVQPASLNTISLVFFICNDNDGDQINTLQDQAMTHGLEPEGVSQCLVIGLDDGSGKTPYHMMGFAETAGQQVSGKTAYIL